MKHSLLPKESLIRVAIGVGAILLIPLALTLFNPNASIYGGPGGGWDWMPGDFLVMGTLLFFTGCAIDVAARRISNPVSKTIAICAIICVLLLIWVQLAVEAVSQFISFLMNTY